MNQKYIDKRREIAEKLAKAEWNECAPSIKIDEIPEKLRNRKIKEMLPLAEVCLKEMVESYKLGIVDAFSIKPEQTKVSGIETEARSIDVNNKLLERGLIDG